MKNLKTFILSTLILTSSLTYNVLAKNSEKEHEQFCNYLGQSLEKVKNTSDINETYAVVNEINRISKLYPTEWLADYYVAYINLSLAFRTNGNVQNKLIEEAKNKIDKLLLNKDAELSEIITLQGYYYYALIAQSPQENGQKYYKDVVTSYNKAIAINGNNPRPVLLLALFKNRMSKFMGESTDSFCTELDNIENMLNGFTPKEALFPTWGIHELQYARKINCMN